MKRLLAGLVVLAVILVAAVMLLPYLVSSEGVRAHIVAQAQSLTGRQMSFRDAPRISLSPYLGIEINSVIFEGSRSQPDDPPLVQMEKLRARIALLPLLVGRIEIYQYQFVRPRFSLRVFADGGGSWTSPGGQVWEVLGRARDIRQAAEPSAKVDLGGLPRLPIGDFEIVDGIVGYDNAVNGARETVTNINARFTWADTASAWSMSGSGIWRDESMQVSATTVRPLLLLAGGTSPATIDVASGAFKFGFSGDANLLAGLHLSGAMTLSSPSVARLVEFFGGKLDAAALPGAVQVTGKLNGTTRQMQVADAVVAVDGNEGRGVLQVLIGETGRLQINATLAFQSLDLSPYLGALRQEAEVGRPDAQGLKLLGDFDCDIRLSAGKATLGVVTATSIGAALSVRNGETLFDIGSATLYGGSATGKLKLGKQGEASELNADVMLSGVGLAPVVALLPKGRFGLSGKADVKLTAKSAGHSVSDLVSGLRGWASLQTGQGVLSGANLRQIRATLSRNEKASQIKLSGETAFTSMKGDLIFDRRTVWLRAIEVQGADFNASFGGRADLASGGLALRARLSGNGGDPAAPDNLLFVGGLVSEPLVTRDVDNGDEPFDPSMQ